MPKPELSLDQTIGSLIRRAQQHHLASWAAVLSGDLTSVQFAALVVLSKNPGMGQKELAAALDIDASTATDLSSRMLKAELISRSTHHKDARRYQLSLTELGQSELARLTPSVVEVQKELAKNLTPQELDQLKLLLLKLL